MKNFKLSEQGPGVSGWIGPDRKPDKGTPFTKNQFYSELVHTSPENVWSDHGISDTQVPVIAADKFLATINISKTFSVPRTLNTLDWWKCFDQGSIGSCFGCSDCQTATGVLWMKTKKRIEFSKFFHYILTQSFDNMLGRDVGSVPTTGVKVAAKIGYCPEIWTPFLEEMYVATYGEASNIPVGKQWVPSYPKDYATGLRQFKPLLDAVKNPESKLRKVMAMFRMDKCIVIDKANQIVKAKVAGIGFVQQSSLWPSAMDEHPTLIKRFKSKITNEQHGGGHAYQIMDLVIDGPVQFDANSEFQGDANFGVGNTWSPRWGDEGIKTADMDTEQEIIDDRMSIVNLKTDMPYIPNGSQEAREVPLTGTTFF